MRFSFIAINFLIFVSVIGATTLLLTLPVVGQDNSLTKRNLTLEAGFGKPYINGSMPGLLRISPNDKWIACVWSEDARGYSEIWLFSMDGSKRKRLTDTKELRKKELSEENEKIENADDRKTDKELLEALEDERNFSNLEWDRKGENVWFIYRGDLCVMNPFDDSQEFPKYQRILKLDRSVGDIKFSEDGEFLALSIWSEIWIRRQNDGALWKLTTSSWSGKAAYGLEWSASGRYLGFYEYDSSGLRTSWMADYMTKDVSPIPLTRPRPGDNIGRVKFGYIDLQAEGDLKVVLVTLDGVDEFYNDAMKWAPDCDRLLVSRISKDTETLSVWEVIDFDKGKAVKLFEYTDEAWFNDAYNYVYWGPDPDSFVCLLEKTDWSQVYHVNFSSILKFEKDKYEKEKQEAEDKIKEKSGKTETSISHLNNPRLVDEVDNVNQDDKEQTGEINDEKLPEETASEQVDKEPQEPQRPPNPEPLQITFGEFEVTWMQVLDDRRTAFIITTEDGPEYRTIQKFDIPSRGKKRLTPKLGMYSFSGGWGEGLRISESERTALVFGSDYGLPAQLHSLNLESVGTHLVLDSRPPDWNTWRWVFPEQISYMNTEFPGRVYALLFLPPYHKEGDKRPVVVHIHGAGYAQDVFARHAWFDALHTYMADTLGYIVLVVDYRGSSGYGRKWRTEVAGQLGKLEDSDARAGVEYLKRSGIVDPQRVGIWGWSYGGFQTNMSMFISPDYWKAGVAMAAPNDWHNYNHWYVTQRLDDPKENDDAYKRSSPITFAKQLTGDLLMVHGILDDNVMAQDFMQLTAELINENRKFDQFVFPEDSHGIHTSERMIYFAQLVCDYFEDRFGRGLGASEISETASQVTNSVGHQALED